MSYKTDLDFWIILEGKKHCFITKEIWYMKLTEYGQVQKKSKRRKFCRMLCLAYVGMPQRILNQKTWQKLMPLQMTTPGKQYICLTFCLQYHRQKWLILSLQCPNVLNFVCWTEKAQTPISLDSASTALQNFGQSPVNRSRSGNSPVDTSRS